jgi:putative ATPase
MRPKKLKEVVGQTHVVGPEGLLTRSIGQSPLPSFLLWGPPGCGKTTIARLVAEEAGTRFVPLSAVLSGIKDLRLIIDEARVARRPTLLFVDEIHRWNKAQQDALLPHVEDGTVSLIGATTENPSFQVIAALRSRAEVVALHPLEPQAIQQLLERALEDAENGLGGRGVTAEPAVLQRLSELASGDARRALGLLERLVGEVADQGVLDEERARLALQRRDILYDRAGEEHYNLVSALIKSMRGSDPDAAIYWLARMLEGGEDVLFLARRLVIFASEDVGNADPRALSVAVAAADASRFVGLPEARLHLAQATTYLASAPKSKAAYNAIGAATAEIRRSGALPVPMHLRNAPTKLLEEMGCGAGYQDPHQHPQGYVKQQYLPDRLEGRRFYEPVDWGHEKTIAQRLEWWRSQGE